MDFSPNWLTFEKSHNQRIFLWSGRVETALWLSSRILGAKVIQMDISKKITFWKKKKKKKKKAFSKKPPFFHILQKKFLVTPIKPLLFNNFKPTLQHIKPHWYTVRSHIHMSITIISLGFMNQNFFSQFSKIFVFLKIFEKINSFITKTP